MRAQFNLGSMYLTGRGVTRDVAKGRAWLEKAAAGGYRGGRPAFCAIFRRRQAAEPKGAAIPVRGGPHNSETRPQGAKRALALPAPPPRRTAGR